MNMDFTKELFPGILTIIIPVLLLVAVWFYSRRQQQRVKREWEQMKQHDPNLRDWARMEEEIKPSRQWYGLPVLLLVAGWTVGIGSMNYFSTATALGIAGGASLFAITIAAVISRKRAAARQLLMNTPAYQQYGHQHLGLAWFIKMFIIASLVGLVSGFLRSEGGMRWIKERFGHPSTEESRAMNHSVNSPAAADNSVQLPANFPADIPIYPGATVESATPSGEAVNVTLTALDSQERVARYYREELKKNGWRIDDKHTRADRIDAFKGKRRCTVRLTETGATRTRIIISG
jgi:hypothetical protein